MDGAHLLLNLLWVSWLAPSAETASPAIDFSRQVRPILSDKCFQCHGPDAAHRKAGLRLDTFDGITSMSRDGRPIVTPGDAQQSLLVDRLYHQDPGSIMPPPRSGKSLNDEEREILVSWIQAGATWREHWSFVRPVTPEVPSSESAWSRGEIDHFIESRLGEEGLEPSGEADRRTWLRRVTFDLVGLPPTLEEIRAFEDDHSAEAYESVVDRLLASPQYGEHQARYWLDGARYGDTHGLHLDNYREMWPYRDWVISAFNDNMPFDQFAIEQLAGDLTEDPSRDQLIASGFNRCHVTTNEGGSITEEVYVRNVVDRVSTMGTVFLGLTVGCALCHDHKFDPISQREFFQFFAFFNNLDGNPMDGNAKAHAPTIRVPSEEQEARGQELSDELTDLESVITERLAEYEYREPEVDCDGAPARHTTLWVDDEIPPGASWEGDALVWVKAGEGPVHTGRSSMKRVSRGNQQHFFRNAQTKLRIGHGDRLFAWIYIDPADPPREIMLQYNSDGGDAWNHRVYWGENLIPWGADGTVARRHGGALPPSAQWHKLVVDPAWIGLPEGSVVHGMAFTQFDGTAYWDGAGIESALPQQSEDFVWIDDDVPSGAKLEGHGEIWNWIGAEEGPVAGGTRSLRRSGGDGLNQDFFTGASPLTLHTSDRLFAHVYLDPEDPPRSIQLQFNNGNWEHRVRWGDPAYGAGQPNGADHVAGPIPALGEWIRLEVAIADVGLKNGDRLNGWAFTQVGGTVYWDYAGVHTWAKHDDRYLYSQLAWERKAAGDSGFPKAVVDALAKEASTRSDADRQRLSDYYLRYIFDGTREVIGSLQTSFDEAQKELDELREAMPTTLIMKERDTPRQAYILNRGLYDHRGDEVTRATPAVLHPMKDSYPRDRMGLAQWIVDPENPLTARVLVNRVWQQFFGVGLVKTSEDFGSQGEPPSHPKLLDWLATTFVDGGWNLKALMKEIALSSTYRQSSRIGDELFRIDPENRLLARGPRFRLDAEMIRDQALAVSGLLVDRIGGASVKPPQPDGLWFAVGYSSSNTAKFRADQGHEKVHRRSLYTFIKRTAPPPIMGTFDAPNRESCQVRRERTNTPLQALLCLNDPQLVEAARMLAARTMNESGLDGEAIVHRMFERATGRIPRYEEVQEILGFAEAQRQEFQRNPKHASELLEVGEASEALLGLEGRPFDPVQWATWTVVANLILNLDEAVTKS